MTPEDRAAIEARDATPMLGYVDMPDHDAWFQCAEDRHVLLAALREAEAREARLREALTFAARQFFAHAHHEPRDVDAMLFWAAEMAGAALASKEEPRLDAEQALLLRLAQSHPIPTAKLLDMANAMHPHLSPDAIRAAYWNLVANGSLVRSPEGVRRAALASTEPAPTEPEAVRP